MIRFSTLLRAGIPAGSSSAYGFAVLCFTVASLARLVFNVTAPDIQSFATYYPAVLFSALIGGTAAGLLTLSLSAVFGWWAFLPPYFALSPPTLGETIDVLLFVVASLVIVWGATAYRQILWRLNEEEHFRQVTVDELAHRVKNNLATVYAILRRELRTHPEIWDNVQGRLHALASTDEFVRSSANGTASFRDILIKEFLPYDLHRFSYDGPDVQLPRKLAITIALVIHELATNAVKHGALSNPAGEVVICWKIEADVVRCEWVERYGPPVQSPGHRGFGLSLIENSLRPYSGGATLRFEPTGLTCRFSFAARIGETVGVSKIGAPQLATF